MKFFDFDICFLKKNMLSYLDLCSYYSYIFFQSIELAKEFKDKIDECQKNLIENPPTVSAEPQQSGRQ